MKQEDSVYSQVYYFPDRLRKRLEEIRFSSATVVEAPSGYGKTSAIQNFLKTELPQGTPVYWFTATEESPTIGYRRLCQEIYKIDNSVGGRLLELGLPTAVTIGEACDDLRSIECKSESYLIIDSFQYFQNILSPSFLSALIEHGGTCLHVIIVTHMLKKDIRSAIAGRGFLHLTVSDLRLDAGDIRRYYALADVKITPEDAQKVVCYTEGWILAVYLQLQAFREKGTFSEASGIVMLMEYVVWDSLTPMQQALLLRLSPFGSFTMKQIGALTGCDIVPNYALEILECPFVRYDQTKRRYQLHSLLSELLILKREEHGADFERECLLQAGDVCRNDGQILEAVGFYWEIKEYERLLSLDFSEVMFKQIRGTPFTDLALEVVEHCPAKIKQGFLPSMLRIAWTLLATGEEKTAGHLIEELQILNSGDFAESDYFLGEWLLLTSFMHHPDVKQMTAILRQVDLLFKGRCSKVVFPSAPWWFGDYSLLSAFHTTPGEADRVADELDAYVPLLSKVTNGYGSGANVLYRAELAYQRGHIDEAKIFAHKALFLAQSRQQSIVEIGATMLLAEVALHQADVAAWQRTINSMDHVVSYAAKNSFIVRPVLDIVRGILLCELKHQQDMAKWLQRGEFTQDLQHSSIFDNALFVHLNYLMHQGEFERLLGIVQAIKTKVSARYPFADFLLFIIEAVGHVGMGNYSKASLLVEEAAALALPDRILFPLASYSWMLNDLPDLLFRKKYPIFLDQYRAIKERFAAGWNNLFHNLTSEDLPSDLTAREYEVAKLAAAGLRNGEIATKLSVTENTVRFHLRAIFQKLDIDRRAKLAEKLKS
jgi:LuxR family maltose regulon positive regulatory protein